MGLTSTKAKRDRLFKKSRPLVRAFNPENDMWVLWAAYDLDSFSNIRKGMTRQEFETMVMSQVNSRSSCLVVEDDCKYFREGRGPVCFVVVDNYGWRIEPHVDFFRWATPRMILRCNVAFFQMVRYSREVGICVVRCLEDTSNLFNRVKKYGLLFDVGRIPNGDPMGDEFLFCVKGQKQGKDLMKAA